MDAAARAMQTTDDEAVQPRLVDEGSQDDSPARARTRTRNKRHRGSGADPSTPRAAHGGHHRHGVPDALDPQVWVKPLELDATGLETKLGKLDQATRAAVEAAIIAETAAMKSSSWPVPDKEWADFTPDEKRRHLPAVMAAALRELGVAHRHVDKALAEKEAAEKGAAGQPAP